MTLFYFHSHILNTTQSMTYTETTVNSYDYLYIMVYKENGCATCTSVSWLAKTENLEIIPTLRSFVGTQQTSYNSRRHQPQVSTLIDTHLLAVHMRMRQANIHVYTHAYTIKHIHIYMHGTNDVSHTMHVDKPVSMCGQYEKCIATRYRTLHCNILNHNFHNTMNNIQMKAG